MSLQVSLSKAAAVASSHVRLISLKSLCIDEIHVVGGLPCRRLYGFRTCWSAIFAGVVSLSRIKWPNHESCRDRIAHDHGSAPVLRYTSMFDTFLGHLMLSTAVRNNRRWKASMLSIWTFVSPHSSLLYRKMLPIYTLKARIFRTMSMLL